MKTETKKEPLLINTPKIDEQKKSDTNKYMLHDCMIALKRSSRTIKTNQGRQNSEYWFSGGRVGVIMTRKEPE